MEESSSQNQNKLVWDVMEESSSQNQNKLVWDGDAKAVQQCLTDIFTSVYTTCDIPPSAIFGPCVLSHTSLYDSIAFIALKATDKRTAPYIFRVDTSATNSTSEGLMWLRLVQSSRDRQEQNLEAYVKSGQLFYRSLRRIQKDEELLVWYGKELVELLLLTSSSGATGAPGARPGTALTSSGAPRPVTAAAAASVAGKTKGPSPSLSCPDCSQRFQFEFPFLAHLRFRCTKRLQQSLQAAGPEEEPADQEEEQRSSSPPKPPRSSPKLGRSSEGFPPGPQDTNKPSMDFHNLARDLENNNNSSSSPRSDKEAEIRSESLGKRKFSEVEEPPREPREPREPPREPREPREPPREPREPPREPRVPAGLPATAATKSKDELASSAQNYRGAYGLEEKRRAFSPPRPPSSSEPPGAGEAKRSAFTEVKKTGSSSKQHGAGKTLQSANSENKDRPGGIGPSSSSSETKHLNIRQVLSETQPLGSAFTSVGAGGGRSAFSQPSRLSFSSQMAHGPLGVMPPGAKLLGDGGCHPAVGDALLSSGRSLYQAADHLAAKLHAAEMGGAVPGGVVMGGMKQQSPFVYAAQASFRPTIQLQVPSALTLLPPSFTSLCLPAQNWCAKCNASFRMTSDLVYHMRSHHKKEFGNGVGGMEPLVKRRREEKLKCPICNESFRERHHLSRHMTSHN